MRAHKLPKASLFASILLAAACGQGAAPETPSPVYLSPLEQDTYTPTPLPDPGSGVSEEELKRFGDLFGGVEQNADALFNRPDVEDRLDLVERAYLSASRYQDLVAMYAQHVQKHGTSSRIAPRLAWAWIKLGQEQRAEQLVTALLNADRSNPNHWFLYGAHWLREAETNPEAATRVVIAWRELIKLAPGFMGFDGIDATAVRREIEVQQRRQLTDKDKLKAIEQELLTATPSPTQPEQPEQPAQPEQPTPQPEPATEQAPTPAVEEVAPPQPTPAPQAAPTPPPAAKPAQDPPSVLIVKAQLAMSSRALDQASLHMERAYRQLIQGHADLATALKAQPADQLHQLMTFIQLDWELGRDKNDTARAARALFERQDLSAPTLYEAAMFSLRKLEDKALTKTLIERLKAKDAAYYQRSGAAALSL